MVPKVLFLLDTLSPTGGAERIAVNIAVSLKSSGNYLPIFCSTRYGGSLEEQLNNHGIRYVLLERSRTYEINKFRQLVSLLTEEDIMIIHSHLQGSNFWGSVIGRFANVPIIITHNHGQSYNKLKSRIIDKIISVLSHKMIFLSKYEMDTFINKIGCDPNKCITIYNGIKHNYGYIEPNTNIKNNLSINPANLVVGIVAGFRPEKNHKTFLLAAHEVLKMIKNVTFLLVGEGNTKKDMEKLALNLGIYENCIFTGFQEDVTDFLSILDIGCLSSSREGLGLALLEYMAFHKPIVATNVGGISEVVKDGTNGFLVPSGDYKLMAAKMIMLLNDRTLRHQMGNEGFSIQSNNFLDDDMVNSIEELYNHLIKSQATK